MKKLVLLSLIVVGAMAQPYTSNYGDDNQKKQKGSIGIDIPLPQKVEPYPVVRNRWEKSTSDKIQEYNAIRKARIDRADILKGRYNISVAQYPRVTRLKDIETIKLLNGYDKVVNFEGYNITGVTSSTFTGDVEYSNNTAVIYPPNRPEELGGSITFFLSNGKINRTIILLIKPLIDTSCTKGGLNTKICKKETSPIDKSSLAPRDFAGDSYYAKVVFKDNTKVALKGEEIIMSYLKNKGDYALHLKNGQSVSFLVDGISYTIKRDDNLVDNFIEINGKKYRAWAN